MKHHSFVSLMQTLDAALVNEYGDELEDMTAEEIFQDIIDCTGTREFDEVPLEELYTAIEKWKDKNL